MVIASQDDHCSHCSCLGRWQVQSDWSMKHPWFRFPSVYRELLHHQLLAEVRARAQTPLSVRFCTVPSITGPCEEGLLSGAVRVIITISQREAEGYEMYRTQLRAGPKAEMPIMWLQPLFIRPNLLGNPFLSPYMWWLVFSRTTNGHAHSELLWIPTKYCTEIKRVTLQFYGHP